MVPTFTSLRRTCALISIQLPGKVDEIFKRAEDEEALPVVPSIVIGETIFTLLKGQDGPTC
jgi:hypothetical protein